MVVAQVVVPDRALGALRGEALEILGSLRVTGRPIETLTVGEHAPLAARAPRLMTGTRAPWTVEVPGGWWITSGAETARIFGDAWPERALSAPFENIVITLSQTDPNTDDGALRDAAMQIDGAVRVDTQGIDGLPGGAEFDAVGGEGEVRGRIFVARRPEAVMVAQVSGEAPSPRRLREVIEMIRSARLAVPIALTDARGGAAP